jgi:formate-dependent nitrite reductase membrane component NrfD
MIQTRPYEFMVQFTPQREWVEGRGILFWLAFFFIELGAGAFFVSSIFGSLPGMLLGWLISAVLGGGLHLLYLGHPLRFWRIIFSSGWKTSWISRGLYFVTLFLILGLIYMILAYRDVPSVSLLIVVNVFAFLTIIYGGFVMNYVNGIQLWNSALLPIMFAVSGIWGGIGLSIVAVSAASPSTIDAGGLEDWGRLFLVSYIFILIVYLMSIRYRGSAGKASIREIVTGRWAPLFWVLVVALGVILPLIVSLLNWKGGLEISGALLSSAIVLELIGDLSLRYCILRCAYYSPLIPTTNYA